ncbi:alpha-amylase family glycosyl hydrolase [Corynebacterium guangdongense]|uniref:Glycosidase n=1 Tax=Corynebacterium guangdongense TaxID=1783348 RepID=A0ABU1ZVP5_9CORY|nr:alpha-amylase family glycosyl hydrolase [Corynebacterium guangdongense]MDR7328930.1 glycosidase [Corynebacterium guangdongense]WJZ17503.1 Cyclomaltodextrinase [Corynebacterium guangdongense]
MALLDHAVIWHLYPLGATGAGIRQTGTPGRGIDTGAEWLDYAIELGCDTILLGPVFESVSHGYDTLDHYRIDARLGGDEAFDAFLAQCRQRGISVLLDGVFNHVAAGHPWARAGLTTGRGWEGHDDLVELNHADARVADEVVAVMEHWLGRGVAGWRLDVAYAVPGEFWAEVTGRVRQNHPDAVFLGEVIHGDYAEILRAGHLDAVTQYELWKAIWSSLKDHNFHELAHALERHNGFLDAGHMQTFVGNHDVDRIASTVGDAGAAAAVALLMTLPGVPSVYYGDEQAFRGVRGTGFEADDAVRPALPDSPAGLAPLGGWMRRWHHDLIAFRRRHSWLSTARVEVTELGNELIAYRVSGAGGSLNARIALGESVSVSVAGDDGETITGDF